MRSSSWSEQTVGGRRCAVLERGDLAADARFNSIATGCSSRRPDRELEKSFAQRKAADWIDILLAAAPAADLNYAQALASEHAVAAKP